MEIFARFTLPVSAILTWFLGNAQHVQNGSQFTSNEIQLWNTQCETPAGKHWIGREAEDSDWTVQTEKGDKEISFLYLAHFTKSFSPFIALTSNVIGQHFTAFVGVQWKSDIS